MSVEQNGNIVDEFKKGWRTTEFWVATITGAIPVGAWAAKAAGYDVDTEELTAAMVGIVPSFVYIFSRGWLKRQRIEGVVATTAIVPAGPAESDLEDEMVEPDPGQLDALDTMSDDRRAS